MRRVNSFLLFPTLKRDFSSEIDENNSDNESEINNNIINSSFSSNLSIDSEVEDILDEMIEKVINTHILNLESRNKELSKKLQIYENKFKQIQGIINSTEQKSNRMMKIYNLITSDLSSNNHDHKHDFDYVFY